VQHHDRICVKLWQKVVGYLLLLENKRIAFEYDTEFKSSGLEISPFEMPLATTAIHQSQEGGATFLHLPGVIADCLPDQYGKSVIEGFYRKVAGWNPSTLNPLDYLVYLSDRSIGALEFEPAIPSTSSDHALDLAQLLKSAHQTLHGHTDNLTPDIFRISASAGGKQAKAIIDFNPNTKEIRTGFAEVLPGFVPCLMKLDGVRDGDVPNYYGRLEYIYAEMARACGIDFPRTYLLETESDEGPAAHFIVERFDRNLHKEKVCHVASLCGLLLRDHRIKQSCTYETFLAAVEHLTNDHSQVEEAFRRAVFNIIFRNQDDHTKNFGFVMDQKGNWRLAPAFDLNYVFGIGSSMTHQMTLAGKDDEFSEDDLLNCGKKFGIKPSKVKAILSQTQSVAQRFLNYAEETFLDEAFARGIKERFRKI